MTRALTRHAWNPTELCTVFVQYEPRPDTLALWIGPLAHVTCPRFQAVALEATW